MVYYSTQAEYDLTKIFVALLSWASDNGQVHMDREHVIIYYNDLYHAFDGIDRLPYHAPVRYATHAKYGKYAYTYKRNKRTAWYGIYNFYAPDAFLNRILSNYRTISGID